MKWFRIHKGKEDKIPTRNFTCRSGWKKWSSPSLSGTDDISLGTRYPLQSFHRLGYIYMSVVRLPSMETYWNHGPVLPTHSDSMCHFRYSVMFYFSFSVMCRCLASAVPECEEEDDGRDHEEGFLNADRWRQWWLTKRKGCLYIITHRELKGTKNHMELILEFAMSMFQRRLDVPLTRKRLTEEATAIQSYDLGLGVSTVGSWDFMPKEGRRKQNSYVQRWMYALNEMACCPSASLVCEAGNKNRKE